MATATATAITSSQFLRISCFSSIHRPKPLLGSAKYDIAIPNFFSTARLKCYFPVRASNSQDENSGINNTAGAFTSPEDLNYLWKLGAGCIAGAAVIKYGSILLPEITRPNIVQALIMISAPVVVAVILLIKQSRVE